VTIATPWCQTQGINGPDNIPCGRLGSRR